MARTVAPPQGEGWMSAILEPAQIEAAEQALLTALQAHDVDALSGWLSPALFFTDPGGQWLGAHPCVSAWSSRQLRISTIDEGERERLLCGQLALVSSDVRLGYATEGAEHQRQLRLLRVWASCSSPAGLHLLSVGVLPARGG